MAHRDGETQLMKDELGFGVAETAVRCDVVEQIAACHAVGGFARQPSVTPRRELSNGPRDEVVDVLLVFVHSNEAIDVRLAACQHCKTT